MGQSLPAYRHRQSPGGDVTLWRRARSGPVARSDRSKSTGQSGVAELCLDTKSGQRFGAESYLVLRKVVPALFEFPGLRTRRVINPVLTKGLREKRWHSRWHSKVVGRVPSFSSGITVGSAESRALGVRLAAVICDCALWHELAVGKDAATGCGRPVALAGGSVFVREHDRNDGARIVAGADDGFEGDGLRWAVFSAADV